MSEEIIEENEAGMSQEELLNLVESGDVFNILSEGNMSGFNELMKYEMITVKDDKVFLTSLGKEAQIHGVKNVIGRKNVESIASGIPVARSFKTKKNYLIWSLVFLFLALLLIVFQYIWM